MAGVELLLPSRKTQEKHHAYIGAEYNSVKIIDIPGYVLSGSCYRAVVECICPFDAVSFVTYLTHVISGMTKSCGCNTGKFHAEANTTHGDSRTSSEFNWLHRFWSGVMYRCYTDTPAYRLYKDRAPLEAYWTDYASFKREWIAARGGLRPAKGQSLDRIDNNARYSIANLRFADNFTQMQNTSSTIHVVSSSGESKPLIVLYRESKSSVRYVTALTRVRRKGLKLSDAFETPYMEDWKLK